MTRCPPALAAAVLVVFSLSAALRASGHPTPQTPTPQTPTPAQTSARGTVPTFRHAVGDKEVTLAGRDPARKGTTTLSTLIVPVTLTFAGRPGSLAAEPDLEPLLDSPVFSDFRYGQGESTQFADALLHASLPAARGGHTLLKKAAVKPLAIEIPAGYGYLLTSAASGRSIAVVDQEYLERQIFERIPRQRDRLVLAYTHNATYYAAADATVCCTWGTHGVDAATGNSFVMSTYLAAAPSVVRDRDVQPITEQLAEFIHDPLHDSGSYFHREGSPGNFFEPWVARQDESGCGGSGVGSNYFLLQPTDTNAKNNFPASPPYVVAAGGRTYHLQNVALLPWYLGPKAPAGAALSFPDPEALTSAARPCSRRPAHGHPTAAPAPAAGGASRHRLIGYWTGSDGSLPLGAVAPQWDVILVAFAPPKKDAPEGTLFFEPPRGTTPAELRAAIAGEHARGRTVMLSLGGGGEFFRLDRAEDIPHFVDSVTHIVTDYGFEGVDIDFESPSLALAPGDTDFRRPTTPSIVNLIQGLRELRDRFGPAFRISLVPEGSQVPAARVTYGGQFGSYLPLIYGLRDILTFVDVQDYNTPPLEGLDGEIYQSSSVDYHAAMTELLLEGFDVAGDPARHFPPVPADKVAVGFLTGYTKPQGVSEAMRYLVTGRAPAGTRYRLRRPSGHPSLIGAMFWTIDEDRRDNYSYSNLLGPELHGWPSR